VSDQGGSPGVGDDDLSLTHAAGRILTTSVSLARLLGYDRPADLVGLRALDIVHPDDRPYIAERIESIYATRKPTPAALQRLVARDGASVFVEIHSLPITVDGRPGALTIVRPMR
jgi:PAS domain S-box-containing protein